MRRIRPVTKPPAQAAYIAPDVKIAFIIDVLEVAQPLFANKKPQNPGGEGETPVEGESE